MPLAAERVEHLASREIEKLAEHLIKTPLSYHSHLHGQIAEEAEGEESEEETAE